MNANMSAKSTNLDDLSFSDVIEGDIFELADLKLDDQEKKELMGGLLKIVRIRVLDRIDQELRDNEREKLKYILEKENSFEELSSFLNSLGLDFVTISTEEAAKVKVEFLTYIKIVKESGEGLAEFLSKIKNNEI